jgi:7-cyano-7-deazaguanine synthase
MNDEKKKELGIVLVSGGMDSCVAAAIAVKECDVAFLHVNYGQRTESREYLAFTQLSEYYKIPEKRQLCVNLESLRIIGGSALTDSKLEIPKFEKVDDEKGIPITYVPFRNTHIIATAVSWAEVTGATRIYIGAVTEDSAGYPDCRPEYFKALNNLLSVASALGDKLKIYTPIIDMTKTEIVKMGIELNAPLHLSWSCYENCIKACGKCDSCLRRLRAFKEAGYEDQIDYM